MMKNQSKSFSTISNMDHAIRHLGGVANDSSSSSLAGDAACRALRIVLQHSMIDPLGWNPDALQRYTDRIQEDIIAFRVKQDGSRLDAMKKREYEAELRRSMQNNPAGYFDDAYAKSLRRKLLQLNIAERYLGSITTRSFTHQELTTMIKRIFDEYYTPYALLERIQASTFALELIDDYLHLWHLVVTWFNDVTRRYSANTGNSLVVYQLISWWKWENHVKLLEVALFNIACFPFSLKKRDELRLNGSLGQEEEEDDDEGDGEGEVEELRSFEFATMTLENIYDTMLDYLHVDVHGREDGDDSDSDDVRHMDTRDPLNLNSLYRSYLRCVSTLTHYLERQLMGRNMQQLQQNNSKYPADEKKKARIAPQFMKKYCQSSLWEEDLVSFCRETVRRSVRILRNDDITASAKERLMYESVTRRDWQWVLPYCAYLDVWLLLQEDKSLSPKNCKMTMLQVLLDSYTDLLRVQHHNRQNQMLQDCIRLFCRSYASARNVFMLMDDYHDHEGSNASEILFQPQAWFMHRELLKSMKIAYQSGGQPNIYQEPILHLIQYHELSKQLFELHKGIVQRELIDPISTQILEMDSLGKDALHSLCSSLVSRNTFAGSIEYFANTPLTVSKLQDAMLSLHYRFEQALLSGANDKFGFETFFTAMKEIQTAIQAVERDNHEEIWIHLFTSDLLEYAAYEHFKEKYAILDDNNPDNPAGKCRRILDLRNRWMDLNKLITADENVILYTRLISLAKQLVTIQILYRIVNEWSISDNSEVHGHISIFTDAAKAFLESIDIPLFCKLEGWITEQCCEAVDSNCIELLKGKCNAEDSNYLQLLETYVTWQLKGLEVSFLVFATTYEGDERFFADFKLSESDHVELLSHLTVVQDDCLTSNILHSMIVPKLEKAKLDTNPMAMLQLMLSPAPFSIPDNLSYDALHRADKLMEQTVTTYQFEYYKAVKQSQEKEHARVFPGSIAHDCVWSLFVKR